MPAQSQAKRRAPHTAEKPIKRTRVSRACDQCRVAREKCDGLQPTCSTCSTSNRACTYTANPKKRGIQPGYIRTLELALACLFQHNPDNEAVLNEKLAQGGATSLLLSRDSKESNRLHKRWRKARFYADVDKLLSGGEPSRHEQIELLSPSSDEDDSETEEPPVNANRQQASLTNTLRDERAIPQPEYTHPITPSQRDGSAVERLCMPPDSWNHLDLYFTYVQCWLPMCEKHDILKLSYLYPAHGLELSMNITDSGSHAELWSILAVGAMQSRYVSPSNHQRSPFSDASRSYGIAKSLIPYELGNFELGHVKALLNMAVFNLMQSLTEAAWLLVGYASRILEAVARPNTASPRRKHVVLSCCILDSILALHLTRRPYFRAHDVEQIGKIDEDGMDEWQPWSGGQNSMIHLPKPPTLALSNFNALAGIAALLMNSSKALPSGRYAHEMINQIEHWKAGLPPKLDYVRTKQVMFPYNPPAVLLRTTYLCVACVTHPSEPILFDFMDFMESCQEHVGLSKLPSVLTSLVEVFCRQAMRLSLSQTAYVRLQKIQVAFSSTWAEISPEMEMQTQHTPTASRNSTTATKVFTPISRHNSISSAQPVDHPIKLDDARIAPLQLDTQFATPPVTADTHSSAAMDIPGHSADPQYSNITGELEHFFDELAALDSSSHFDNQPQFMQNLGFAPDANMADLFREYMPLQPPNYIVQDPRQIDFSQYNMYNGP